MVYLFTYFIFITLLFYFIGFKKIYSKIIMFKNATYWTDYNIIEFVSWTSKAIIIVPSLLFGIELWYTYFFTLVTSSLLIWVSMRKSLPTLIVFNTLWIIISLTIIVKNLI